MSVQAIHKSVLALAWIAGLFSASAFAAPSSEELNRRIDILAQEIERLKIGEAAASADQVQYGLGPAASKIYRTSKGVSLGGYGEMVYENYAGKKDSGGASGKTDQIDFLRNVLYVGYRFNENFLFNSEIELEHGTSDNVSNGAGAGSVSVEFAYLDYLYRPELNFRAGILLVPMGFLNEMHEPTTFLGARRPDSENLIIPSTWRENGMGVFGDIGVMSYRSYLLNGLNASGFRESGLRNGRQKGNRSRVEDDWAWVTRIDVTPFNGMTAGGSAYLGDSGYYPSTANANTVSDISTNIYELHADWRWMGIQARALAVMADLGNVDELNRELGTSNGKVGRKMYGAYVELGYDVLTGRSKTALIPFGRFERVHTQGDVEAGLKSGANLYSVWTYGLSYKPIDNVVFKADYQDYRLSNNAGVNQYNVALGFNY